VTFEAEAYANTIGGSAWVQRYPGASGGVIVRNIGDWGDRSGDGWLRVNNVRVPAAGTYALTLFSVHLDDEPARTVAITVSGAASIVIQVSGSATCCTATTVRVAFKAGANTVMFTNPNGHAPSIDRIVISGT
jgi:hypothetical protein